MTTYQIKFFGVFPSDKMTKFIGYKQLINQKTDKYPFLLWNSEGSKKDGEYWWSNFFYSVGVEELKNFIITDHKKTVQMILSGIVKTTRTDNKITLVNIKFSMNACKSFSSKEVEKLNDTSRDFFYFVQSFGEFLKIKYCLNIWMVEGPIQMTETVTCGIFQLYL